MASFKELTKSLRRELEAYKAGTTKTSTGRQVAASLAKHSKNTISLAPAVSGYSKLLQTVLESGSHGETDPGPLFADIAENLYGAAELEFSTIPPYLTALWSVMDQDSETARSLRSIVHEEMLHMALINNILSSLGLAPNLTSSSPSYPCSLPGDLHPELTITLSEFDTDQIEVFAEIERPVSFVEIEGEPEPLPDPDDKTVGEFYECLQSAVHELNPEFLTKDQIAGPLAPMVIDNLDRFDQAIELIVTQGEGGNAEPYYLLPEHLAHYYRFREMEIGKRLKWVEAQKKLVKTVDYPLAETYAFKPAPPGGYGQGFSPEVQALSRRFNGAYSTMLRQLENAWIGGGHSSLLRAIESMFEMKPIAVEMMKLGVGPAFIYVPSQKT